jgi:glycosyltransferase involved in cell wall biosynthesis
MPRKGVDVLLESYFAAFDRDDDVTLVVKTHPNPHNDVAEQLDALRVRFPNGPHVCWINRDLDRSALDALYELADVYVHPARGEGFGLPVAEAMLAEVPVIATAAGGLADLVNSETAIVIQHTDAPAQSHLSTPGSRWCEPSASQLTDELRSFFDGASRDERDDRVAAARRHVLESFTWERVAARWRDFIDDIVLRRPGRDVVAITTFNSRCGIAEYAAQLYGEMKDWAGLVIHADLGAEPIDPLLEEQLDRTWHNYRRDDIDDLVNELGSCSADVTHVQYNFGFYSIPQLGRLLDAEARRRPTVLTLHRTMPLEVEGGMESLGQIADQLRSCAAVIVHQRGDVERLAEIGVENVRLIPIGTDPTVSIDKRSARYRHGIPLGAFVVGAYGFLLPHKGLGVVVEAVDQLRDRGVDAFLLAACAIHPDERSSRHLATIRADVERRGLRDHVRLVTDYLPHERSLDLLASSDVLALPYEATQESSSAALRSLLPLGRPIVTSDVDIFDDVRDCVVQLGSPVDPHELSSTLERLWLDDDEVRRLTAAVEQFSRRNDWSGVSRRTRSLYAALTPPGADRPLI